MCSSLVLFKNTVSIYHIVSAMTDVCMSAARACRHAIDGTLNNYIYKQLENS